MPLVVNRLGGGHTKTNTHTHTHTHTHTQAYRHHEQKQFQETGCTPAFGRCAPDLQIRIHVIIKKNSFFNSYLSNSFFNT